MSSVWVCKMELQWKFLQSVHTEFLVSRDAFVYILSVGDILNGKTDFDRCPVSHSPCCCSDFSPLRTFKDYNRQKKPRFILVKTPGCLNGRGKPCKVHEMRFPSLETWTVDKQAVWRSLENSWLHIVEVDLSSRVVLTPGQNLQIKHLARVWNFKWKVCRESSAETIIKIT